MFKRKRNRLDLSLYKGMRTYFVTICTGNYQKVFSDSKVIDKHLKLLNSCCIREQFSVWAYCFMPDHLHLLLATKGNSDLIKLIRIYKQLSGYGYKQTTGKNLWQKSFYDHILRKEENVIQAIRYILENPVRKELIDDFTRYPFSGSLEFGRKVFEM